jgi:hypothetical protein
MQAHEDSPARPTHGVPSYLRGRETIARIFAEAGWRVSPRAIDLRNETEPDHDGFATVIAAEP